MKLKNQSVTQFSEEGFTKILWDIILEKRWETNITHTPKDITKSSDFQKIVIKTIYLNSIEKQICNSAELREFFEGSWEWHSDNETRLIYWFNESLPSGYILGELRFLGKIIEIRNGMTSWIPIDIPHQLELYDIVFTIILKAHPLEKPDLTKKWFNKISLKPVIIIERVYDKLFPANSFIVFEEDLKKWTIPIHLFNYYYESYSN
jgi:hypothetical protein